MAFVLVAHVGFGSQVKYFASVLDCIDTIYMFMLGYLFDDVWEDMKASGGTMAIVWSVLFSIMVILISLNMVLAIIFDVYADVKANAEQAPGVLQQISNFWTAGRRKTDAMDDEDLQYGDEVSNIANDGTGRTSREARESEGGRKVNQNRLSMERMKESAKHAINIA